MSYFLSKHGGYSSQLCLIYQFVYLTKMSFLNHFFGCHFCPPWLWEFQRCRFVVGFLRVPGCSRGGGVPGETLWIPFGKIGVHLREDDRGITTRDPKQNPITKVVANHSLHGASLLSLDSRVAPAMADTNRRWAEGMFLC